MKPYLKFSLLVCSLLLLTACVKQKHNAEIMETSSISRHSLIVHVEKADPPLGPLFEIPTNTYILHNPQNGEFPITLPANIRKAAWSPDEQWLAIIKYIENTDSLYLFHPNKQLEILIDSSVSKLSLIFSPDGTQIAYTKYQDNKLAIYIVDISCALDVAEDKSCVFEPTFLTKGSFPNWTRNNNSIVYTSREKENPGIYLIAAAGTSTPTLMIEDGYHLQWSPDGDNIVYDSYDGERKPGIYLIDAMGTSEPVLLVEDGYLPQWSPDGEKILFMSSSRNPTLAEGIYTVQDDGSKLTQLTEEIGHDIQWSPNGEFITFVSTRDSRCLYRCGRDGEFSTSALYQMTADGDNLTRLTLADDELIRWYAWIP